MNNFNFTTIFGWSTRPGYFHFSETRPLVLNHSHNCWLSSRIFFSSPTLICEKEWITKRILWIFLLQDPWSHVISSSIRFFFLLQMATWAYKGPLPHFICTALKTNVEYKSKSGSCYILYHWVHFIENRLPLLALSRESLLRYVCASSSLQKYRG